MGSGGVSRVPGSSRSGSLRAGAALALVIAAFWAHRVYLEEPVYPIMRGRDVVRHAYPTAVYIHDELRSGNLPIWNPYQMAGQPFLALHITAVLYPPHLLFMGLLPPGRALEALVLFHLLLAGLFTWLFCRRLGLSPPASAVATLAFMLGGTQLTGIYMMPCLAAHSWLPVTLFSLHGLLTEARARWAAALGLSIAFSFLAGYAQGTFYALELALAFGVVGMIACVRRGRRLRVAGLAVAAGVLAFGLCAPQLLPTLELSRDSVRDLDGMTQKAAAFPFVPPATLVSRTLPEWLVGQAEGPAPKRWRFQLPSLAWPLLLPALLLVRRRGPPIFFAAAAVVAALFAVGPGSPVYGWFYALPLGNLFRGPQRIDFVYMFSVAMVCGFGVEGIHRFGADRRGARAAHLVCWALALVFAADVYSRTRIEVPPPARVPPIRGGPPDAIHFLRETAENGRVFVQARIPHRVDLMKKVGMMNGIFAVADYESNMPQAYEDFLFDASPPGFWHGDLTVAPPTHRNRPRPSQRALDLMSVRYYLMLGRIDDDENLSILEETGGTRVRGGRSWHLVERSAAVPRAYAVEDVEYVDDPAAARARVMRLEFEPGRQAVVVGRASADGRPASADRGSVGQVRIRSYEPEEVALEATCVRRCLLVLTDLHYQGWKVSVDGVERPLLRTNAIFRGVWLEPGAHRVVHRFEPRSLRAGILLLALLVPAATAALVGIDRRS